MLIDVGGDAGAEAVRATPGEVSLCAIQSDAESGGGDTGTGGGDTSPASSAIVSGWMSGVATILAVAASLVA